MATHEERNEYGGIHQNERQDSSPAVAETSGDWSGKKNANESTALARLEESTLPFRFDGISIFAFNFDAVPLLESGLRDEITIQKHVEGFHNLEDVSNSSGQSSEFSRNEILVK